MPLTPYIPTAEQMEHLTNWQRFQFEKYGNILPEQPRRLGTYAQPATEERWQQLDEIKTPDDI